jgi:hypothetical protein
LASLGEYQNHLPEAATIQIKAGNKSIVAVINFKNNAKISFHGGSQRAKWNAFIVPIEIKFNGEVGFGCAMFWYPKNIKEFDIQEIPSTIKRVFNRSDQPSIEKLLVSFDDKEAQSVLVSGGKGSSLAVLHAIQESESRSNFFDKRDRRQQILNALVDQISTNPLKRSLQVQNLLDNGIPNKERQRAGSLATAILPDPHDFDIPDFYVPQGFIISVSAIEYHLTENSEIKSVLKELEDIAHQKIPRDLRESCEK